MKRTEFQCGAIHAADIADQYNSSSSHPYRLGDCILAKMNISRAKPRINRKARPSERDAWQVGFAVALSEMHRRLLGGNDSTSTREVARVAGVTIKSARAAGVSNYDLRELKKAGVR
jgi:hypothetical protein